METVENIKNMVTSQDADGNTPLHRAVLAYNYELLSVLLNLSAMVSPDAINIKNNVQLTPLLVAVYLGNISLVKRLLDANADITITDTRRSHSAIHIACNKKNLQILNVLLFEIFFLVFVFLYDFFSSCC